LEEIGRQQFPIEKLTKNHFSDFSHFSDLFAALVRLSGWQPCPLHCGSATLGMGIDACWP
jgi:hypothetical protein